MATLLSSFKDGDAWTYLADGSIVGKARDRSYKEVARGGVPIEVFAASYMEPSTDEVPTAASSAVAAKESACDCDACEYIKDCLVYAEDYALPADKSDDFDRYFAPVVPRSVARARRLAKKPVKVSKYGPKASKVHTVAARIFAASTHITPLAKKCEACGRIESEPGSESDFGPCHAFVMTKTCDRCCDPAWAIKLAAIQDKRAASLAAAMVEREELRMEYRMMDS